jgi:hypothetical protein
MASDTVVSGGRSKIVNAPLLGDPALLRSASFVRDRQMRDG